MKEQTNQARWIGVLVAKENSEALLGARRSSLAN